MARSAAASKTVRSPSAATSSSRSTARRSTSSEDLAADIAAKKPGETVSVGLLRGNGKGGYEHKTVSVKLGEPPELGAQPDHARRLGGPRYRWGRERRPSTSEDLRDHEPRGRRARGRAGRVGARDDLLRGQPAPLLAGRGRDDRRGAAAQGRAVRRVRQRAARAGRRPSEERRSEHAAVPRRRGSCVLRARLRAARARG